MRQVHKAGEKLFVDYCGLTMKVTNPITGEEEEAQIFVACLGASNYIFAEATPLTSPTSLVRVSSTRPELFGRSAQMYSAR